MFVSILSIFEFAAGRGKWILIDGDKIAALYAAFIHAEMANLGLEKVTPSSPQYAPFEVRDRNGPTKQFIYVYIIYIYYIYIYYIRILCCIYIIYIYYLYIYKVGRGGRGCDEPIPEFNE